MILLLLLVYASVLSLIAYYVYRIVFWYHRVMIIGAQVDKLPGDQRHWLHGNVKNLSLIHI